MQDNISEIIQNTMCGQNVELLNVHPDGTYADRYGLKGGGSNSELS